MPAEYSEPTPRATIFDNPFGEKEITHAFNLLLAEMDLEGDTKSPVLDFLSMIYASRKKDNMQRIELLQMDRVARFMTFTKRYETSRESDEFFCGELLGAELVAKLIETRKGTGSLAQDALVDLLRTSWPKNKHSESQEEVIDRQNQTIEGAQEILGNPDNGSIPYQFDSLIYELADISRSRSEDNSLDTQAMPIQLSTHFAMGYRFVIKRAIESGLLAIKGSPASDEEIKDALAETETIKPEEHTQTAQNGLLTDTVAAPLSEPSLLFPYYETIKNQNSVPSLDAMQDISETPFKEATFKPITVLREKIRELAETAVKDAFSLESYDFDSDESEIRQEINDSLTLFAKETGKLSADDIISARGKMYILVQDELIPEGEDKEDYSTRDLVNQNVEIVGTFKSVEVIAIQNERTLRRSEIPGVKIDPDDEEHFSEYIPAMRLSNTVKIYHKEGSPLKNIIENKNLDILIPLIYSTTEISKLSAEDESPNIEPSVLSN